MKRTPLLALLFAVVTGYAAFAYAAPNTDIQEINGLFKQGQYAPALDKVNAYISKNPQDAQARFLKGLILTEQNKSAEAIKVFTSLTEDFPELPEPYNNLAVLYAAQGQYDKAKTELEMAIHTHPSYATAHENLGDIYAKMASIAYDKALQLDNNNASAQTKLSLIKELFSGRKTPSLAKTGDSKSKPVVAAAKPVETAPATAPVPAPVAAAPAPAVDTGAVTDALQSWAKAWSNKDADAYLAAYSPKFKTPKGESRSSWENTRRERINAPKKIEVTLSDINVTANSSDRATVSFKQSYRSDRLSSTAHKTMELVKTHGKWLITEERSR
jgi:tetratricopeptide (TPR) repeat protein